MDQYPPLGDRIAKTSSVGLAEADPLQSARVCRGEYKSWTDERMAVAVSAVIKDGLSVRQAAEEYHVPKSTLADRISGRILPGGRSGPGKYLNDQEEEELVAFCCSVHPLGTLEVA